MKIYEILKINLRIFQLEFDFGIAGLLIFGKYGDLDGDSRGLFASNRLSKVGGIDLVSPALLLYTVTVG